MLSLSAISNLVFYLNFLGILSFWLKLIRTLPFLEIDLSAKITGSIASLRSLCFSSGFQPNGLVVLSICSLTTSFVLV